MTESAKQKSYTLNQCLRQYRLWRFLSPNPHQRFWTKLGQALLLLFLGWTLATLLLFSANCLIRFVTGPFVSDAKRKDINEALSLKNPELPFIQIEPIDIAKPGVGRHEALRALLYPSRTAQPHGFDLIARDGNPLLFFWPIESITSTISLEALIKCYNYLATEPDQGQTKPSEQETKDYLSTLRKVLIDPGETSLSNLEEPFSALAIQRRINGPIQFFSIWGFSLFVILVLLRYVSFTQFQKKLKQVTLIDPKSAYATINTTPATDPADPVDPQDARAPTPSQPTVSPWRDLQNKLEALNQKVGTPDYKPKFEADAKELATSYEDVARVLEKHHCTSIHVSLMQQALVASIGQASRVANIPAFVSHQTQILSTLAYESGTILRYLVWVVPTIGFIGTVFGISHTLQLTSLLDSVDELVKISGKSLVNTAIAVALIPHSLA